MKRTSFVRGRPGPSASRELSGVTKVVFDSARRGGVSLDGPGGARRRTTSFSFPRHSQLGVLSQGQSQQALDLGFVLAMSQTTKKRGTGDIPLPSTRTGTLQQQPVDARTKIELPFLQVSTTTSAASQTLSSPPSPSPLGLPAKASKVDAPPLEGSLSFDFSSATTTSAASGVKDAVLPRDSGKTVPTPPDPEGGKLDAPQRVPEFAEWESLRQVEVQRLVDAQRAEEERRVAAELERTIAAESEVWVQSRPQRVPRDQSDLVSNALYHASWSEASRIFSSLEPHARTVHRYTMTLAKLHGACTEGCSPQQQRRCLETVWRMAKEDKVPSSVSIQSRLHVVMDDNPQAAASLFMECSTAVKAGLPLSLLRRSVRSAVRFGGWETGLTLLSQVKPRVRDPFCFLEAAALEGMASKEFSADAQGSMNAAIDSLVRHLREEMPELGKFHTLAIGRALRRWRGANAARDAVSQFVSHQEMDEAVAGFLMSIARPEHRDQLSAEMQSLGISLASPLVVLGRMHSLAKERAHSAAIGIFVEAKSHPEFHVTPSIAAALVHMAVEEGTRRAAILVSEVFSHIALGGRAQKFNVLLPLLYAHHLADEALKIFDEYAIDTKQLTPNSLGCLNAFLKAKGRAPLSEQLPSTITSATVLAGSAHSAVGGGRHEGEPTDGTQKPHQQQEQHPLIERMLECAKARDWATAVSLLRTSRHTPTTLLYNCALSATMDHPTLMEALLQEMQQRKVVANATTYNTVMSVHAQGERWDAALSLFVTMEPSVRDAGTFSVVLSALGRQNMWVEAASVFHIAKSTSGSPSPAVYSLALQAVHKHSWECALGVFRDMHKTLGAAQVKEIVVTRVVRALENAGKPKEARSVMEMMKGKKKDKTAKKPSTGK